MLLEDGTVVTSKLGCKRKNRSPKPQRKLPDTSAITEHSPEAPSLNSKTLDFDDPGYLTVTTKAKVMMPPAPGAAINVNLNGRIRSHAQPVAQCSQLPALGPTLAELHARNDLPDNIRHWVALSTTTGLYDDYQRLPPHFIETAPHLFTPNALPCRSSASTLPFVAPSNCPTLYPSHFGISFPTAPRVHNLPIPAPPSGVPKQPKSKNADWKKQIEAVSKPGPRVVGSSGLGLKSTGYVDCGNEASEGQAAKTSLAKLELMKYGQAERFNQKIHQSGQSSLRVPRRARDQASLVDEKATGNAINIDDLPQGATVGNRWCEKFIPTVLQYLGTLSNPWDLPDGVILHVLQNVWDIVYGESLPWTIAIDDCVHAIAMRCIHEWQGYFGSSALRAFELLFQSSPHEFPDFQTCAVFCREILPDGRLFYECTYDGVNRGLYRSRSVLAALSEHVNATRGAVHVPKLYPAGYAKHPYGAIGLSAAAVFREAMLFSWKRIGYDNNKHLVVLKSINESAGKLTSKDTAFSEQNFGERTRECATSASKLSAAKIATILDYASQSITMTEWSAAALSFSANTHKCNFANLVDVD
ncbi:hypothetical protein LXA43DRAFT_1099172 [Ganoderma leucocontextum]|nr:hypothetical protein LXA43DRAFT_1099172 [Ganoderma leucocontextum]